MAPRKGSARPGSTASTPSAASRRDEARRRSDWDAAGDADDICSRCKSHLTLSASLAQALPPAHGLDDLSESSLLDANNALASTGIVGMLGLSTYDLIPHGGIPGTPADLSSAPGRPGAAARPDTDRPGQSAMPLHLNSRVLVRTRLMDLLNAHNPPARPSSRSSSHSSASGEAKGGEGRIQHPLCSQCTNDMLSLMEAELSLLRTERGALGHVASALAAAERAPAGTSDGPEPGSGSPPSSSLPDLLAQEKSMRDELVRFEREKEVLEAELRALDEQDAQLKKEEDEFWTAFTTSSSTLAALKAESAQLKQTISLDTTLLQRLQATHVYHDVFSIGHDHGYSTINGLRLGKGPLPGSSEKDVVEWDEINAAWGQTVLLLDTLATKCEVKFTGFTLHPKGSFSSIERHASKDKDAEAFELYYVPSWSVESLWGKTTKRYDKGMEMFLECLRQMMSYASQTDPSVRFPHQINRDKIGEASLRLPTALLGRNGLAGGADGDQAWTRACRYVLSTLKILLNWVVDTVDHPSE